ncbi:hypothetical protein ACLVWU_08480 [Bdellovibrio sp. HCB290]|uniref:hypothetical protein n=1 Tax=Bdellovibrio sp. HCB290 TaxID=3394356 RepID=UPI0039B46B8A
MAKLTNDEKWILWEKFIREKKLVWRFSFPERKMRIPGIREDKPLIFHTRHQAALTAAIFWGVPMTIFAFITSYMYEVPKPDVLVFLFLSIHMVVCSLGFGYLVTIGMGKKRERLGLVSWEAFGEEIQ